MFGLAHTSGVNGAIITGTGAFISLLVAALVFKYERMDLNKVTGCMLGFMGIVLMNMDDFASLKVSFLGDGLVLCSQLCSSFSASFIKKYTQSFNAVMLSGYQFFVGGILLTSIGNCYGRKPFVDKYFWNDGIDLFGFCLGLCLYIMGNLIVVSSCQQDWYL